MITKKIAKDTDNPLQDFDPYPLRIEKKAMEKWYIPAFLPFIIAKLIAIPIYLANEPESILHIGEDVIYLSVPIALSFVVLLYNAWIKQIPDVFLKIKGRFIKPRTQGKMPKNYDQFLREYLAGLRSPARYVVTLVFIASVFYVLVNMFAIPNRVSSNIKSITLQDSLALFKFAYIAVFYIISPVIWAYLAAVGAWIMSVTGWYVWKLPREFEIKVEARHPDKCGGLGFLGAFCLSFAFPILISTVFLGIMGLAGEVAGFRVSSAISDGAVLALIFFAMPLLYFAFFAPVWGIHNEMVVRGKEFLETGAKYIKQLEKKVDESIEKGNFSGAKDLSSELDSLVSYYSGPIPAWPFDKNIIFKFLSPQIFPVLGIVFKLDTLTQGNLKVFLDYLFPVK
jgi:hypothetical protein